MHIHIFSVCFHFASTGKHLIWCVKSGLIWEKLTKTGDKNIWGKIWQPRSFISLFKMCQIYPCSSECCNENWSLTFFLIRKKQCDFWNRDMIFNPPSVTSKSIFKMIVEFSFLSRFQWKQFMSSLFYFSCLWSYEMKINKWINK